MHGPGKYGANAAALLAQHRGSMCVVILIGNRGPGFDVATIDPALLQTLPTLLRDVADRIAGDLAAAAVRVVS